MCLSHALGNPCCNVSITSWLNRYFYSKGEKGIYIIFKEGARVVRVKRPLFVQKRSKLAVFPCINGYEIHIQ